MVERVLDEGGVRIDGGDLHCYHHHGHLVVAIVVVAAAVFVMVLAGRGKEGGRQGGDVRACYSYIPLVGRQREGRGKAGGRQGEGRGRLWEQEDLVAVVAVE